MAAAIDNETLVMAAEEAQSCQAEIEAICHHPLPDLEPTDTYKLWASRKESAVYQQLLDKLARLRYRRLAVVLREAAYDGRLLEARIYMDAWIELYMNGVCFKSYRHT